MCAFLNLMPQTKRIYTYIGQRTMFVYLLHGIVIGVIRGFDLYPFKDQISIFTYLYQCECDCINIIFKMGLQMDESVH